jgi:TonB-linked SusC/RagA family outer membrane protein
MRLSFIFIFAALMQVNAASYGQRVTLNEQNATIAQVLNQIKSQTRIKIVYADEVLNNSGLVSVKLKNASLEDALKATLQNQKLEFSILNNTVIIKEKSIGFLEMLEQRFANIDVSGRVIDNEDKGLPGARITIKGTNRSVASDGNGRFMINDVDEKATLVITYVGFTPREIKADAAQPITVRLEAEVGTLDGTVIVGYGTTTKRRNTGSVTTVTAREIAQQPVSNPIAALQGRVAGLDISTSNGYPGSSMTVRLRGINSINGGNSPLYIVDGIPFASESLNQFSGANGSTSPLNSINPSDIERIDVLKDADATAIYGSRGANGVILITTKKGKSGKTAVDANVYSGISFVNNKVDLLNTAEYLELRREAFKNDGTIPTEANAPDLFSWGQEADNNWIEKLIGKTAKMTEAQLSLSGGSEQTNFLFSGTYRKETTVTPGDQGYYRGSINSSLNHQSVDKRFDFSVSVKYVGDQNNSMPTDVTQYYNTAPNYPIYKADGTFYWPPSGQNPMAYLERGYDATMQNLSGNMSLKYNIFQGLNAKVGLGYNRVSMKQTKTQPQNTYNPSLYVASEASYGNNAVNSYNIEPQLDYTTQLSKGVLKLLAGGTVQSSTNEGLYLLGSGYANDDQLLNPRAATTLVTQAYNFSQYRYISVFGRATYNWDEKYIVNGTFRRDGSSRFGPDKRFGSFGAVGAAWLFSNESFVSDNLPFLSFGKLRGSYGTVGNDQIANYQYYDSWSATDFPYSGNAGLYPSRFANNDYQWEVNHKLEAALELGFLNDRILLTTSIYRNRSSNQLINYTLSSQSGFTSYTDNLPAELQNKGLELELNTINIQKVDFKWNTSFNVSISRNKLLEYPGLASSAYAQTFFIGQPINVVTGYQSTGINPVNGFPTFVDVNNNGTINSADLVPIGNITPKFYGGLQNSLSYKDWSLDVFFQFAKQEGPLLNYGTLSGTYGSRINKDLSALDRWTTPGQEASIPVATAGTTAAYTAYNNWRLSTANWGDASYLRLKNVSLRYNLGTLLKNTKVRNMSVYMQGQNLFTITNYDGFDPETKGVVLPPLTVYTLGLQVSF